MIIKDALASLSISRVSRRTDAQLGAYVDGWNDALRKAAEVLSGESPAEVVADFRSWEHRDGNGGIATERERHDIQQRMDAALRALEDQP